LASMAAAFGASADVIGVSLQEDVGSGGSPQTNTAFPPITMSAPPCTVTINSYSGPTAAGGGGTPGLSLGATLTEGNNVGSCDITYIFKLTEPQPYTFSYSGTGNPNPVYFEGPLGGINAGSGTLPAGNYNLDTTDGSVENSTRTFSLTVTAVPEPLSVIGWALAAGALLQRRRG
jgi:hypothetical protein